MVEGGQLRRSGETPEGKRLAFVTGGWRLADWALNLDAGIIDVDADGKPASTVRPLVTGFHEDFTPTWSPDGGWIAYHSHRSPMPVPTYGSAGSADDLFLRRPAGKAKEEIRLTDFGWEVGPGDWSPDGQKLVFTSWEKGGTPGVSFPWIVTIDPASGKVSRTERLPLPEPIEGEDEAVWSPTRDEIAVIEKTVGKGRTIWVVSGDGKQPQRLIDFTSTTYGGIGWTPDGKTIVYAGLAGTRMQIFAVERSGSIPVG